jgi:hypothetical protein
MFKQQSYEMVDLQGNGQMGELAVFFTDQGPEYSKSLVFHLFEKL